MDANGNWLWGTYFSGNGLSGISDIQHKEGLGIVIAGSTTSTEGLTTEGAYQSEMEEGG